MATAVTTGNGDAQSKPPRPRQICFSFAAYAKNLIERIKSSDILVAEGLSDSEFATLESNFNFCFPPDLLSILQQGLPISPGFPNWRSSSAQQLEILLNLPVLSLLRRVSKNKFWHASWGPKPQDASQALNIARKLLRDAPLLVPIYRHCYIPASPSLAGNPVFYVDHDGDVRLLSYDIAGFFRQADFLSGNRELYEPVWAAKKARRIDFWSGLAEARVDMGGGWWWSCMNGELGGCLEDVFWRLRDGGWKEEEIREMMMMNCGDEEEEGKQCAPVMSHSVKDKEAIVWHVRVLSLMLLRAGWSREDVVYSLGVLGDESKSWLELHQEPRITRF